MIKKIFTGLFFVGFLVMISYVFSPVIPLPINMQKQMMSALYSDESCAEGVANSVSYISRHLNDYGFDSQEDFIAWLENKSWVTSDGATRKIFVEPELLGDIGWPSVVNSVKIKLIYNRAGSIVTSRYYVHSSLNNV